MLLVQRCKGVEPRPAATSCANKYKVSAENPLRVWNSRFLSGKMGLFSSFAVLLLAANGALAAKWIGETKTVDGISYQCKCYSDNTCWPTNKRWNEFNNTLGGALQLAIPPGAPCYNKFGNTSLDLFDPKACAEVKANWGNEQWL
jgi:hypothetical protein